MTVGGEPDLLTQDELAERAGGSPDQVARLVDLGILEPVDGGFTRRDLARARVVLHLQTMGIEPASLAQALHSGHLTLGYFESAGRRHPLADRTFRDVAAEIGVPAETLERIYVAFGLPRPQADEHVREELQGILHEIQDGSFAREWIADMDAGETRLQALRAEAGNERIEVVGRELRSLMHRAGETPAEARS